MRDSIPNQAHTGQLKNVTDFRTDGDSNLTFGELSGSIPKTYLKVSKYLLHARLGKKISCGTANLHIGEVVSYRDFFLFLLTLSFLGLTQMPTSGSQYPYFTFTQSS
jgi:hypothetical protein